MTSRFQRSSPVHDLQQPLDPEWRQVQGMLVAWSFQSPEEERKRRVELALCDLSCLPRMSLKGPEAVGWLAQVGIKIPAALYEYSNWNGDGLIIRTDSQEVLLEDGPEGQGVAQLMQQHLAAPSGVYRVERQEACFRLSGGKARDVLLETCGYDFRQPGDRLVMTRVAGVSCAVLPLEAVGVPIFRLWLDCSYGVYLWEVLFEIVSDHGGEVVGMGCFYPELAGS